MVSVPFIRFLQTIFVVSNYWLLLSPTVLVLSKNSDKASCYPVLKHLMAAVSCLSNLYMCDKTVPESQTGQVMSLPEEKW